MWRDETFFGKLYKPMAQKNWSLNELSNRAGLSSGMIYKWTKKDVEPTVESLIKVAKALEVPVEYFFETEVSDGKRDKIKLLTELAGQLTENQIDVIINMIRGLTRENL